MLPGRKLAVPDILQMVRRRLWLIVIPPMVTLLPALVYSSRIPNLYQSDMLISIDPQRVPDAFVRSTVTLGTDIRMEAISVRVRSRTNLQAMIEELDLYHEQRSRMPMEDVVQMMSDRINVVLERGSGRQATAFHVQFTHSDPNIAARVTQQLGSLFVEQNSRDRGALASATNVFLDTQLNEARARLVQQEQRLEQFRQKHGKELPTQMLANLQALQSKQLQVQSVVEAIARDRDRRMLQDRLYREAEAAALPVEPAAASATGSSPGVQVGASPEQQLAAARSMLASLELRYKPDHPDVIRTKGVIQALESQVSVADPVTSTSPVTLSAAQSQRRERLGQMAAEIESLDRQIAFRTGEEKRLRDEIAEYQRRVEAVPGLESDWVALTRDYDTQQIAYKELLTKSGAAKLAVDLEEQQIGEHFRIVDPANVPVRPLPSVRLRVNAVGLALGLFLGLGVAALLEFRDASYRTDAEVLEILSLPVLARVPYVETDRERRRQTLRAVAFSGAGLAGLAGAGYVVWAMKLWQSIR